MWYQLGGAVGSGVESGREAPGSGEGNWFLSIPKEGTGFILRLSACATRRGLNLNTFFCPGSLVSRQVRTFHGASQVIIFIGRAAKILMAARGEIM